MDVIDNSKPSTTNNGSETSRIENIPSDEGIKKPNETEQNGNEYQEFPGGPFKKNNPGGGREKETEEERLSRIAKKEALETLKENHLNKFIEALEEINPALIKKAKEGDVSAIKEIHDRIFGKPKQGLELSGDKDAPISISISEVVALKNNLNDITSEPKHSSE